MSAESPSPPSPVQLPRAALSAAAALLVLLVPTDAGFTPQVRIVAATGLLMGLLWLTEALPLGMTALLPLVIFPATGVRTAEQAAAPYGNAAVFLFLGGFLVASAIESWGLHRRVAWLVLSAVGTGPRRIVLALLLVSAGLSMWISNTATTLMLAPIGVAVVVAAEKRGGGDGAGRLGAAALLAIAYGASLGGLGTPIGTPTNVIFLGASKELFPTLPAVGFAQWMGFGVAYLAVAIPACWAILVTTTRLPAGDGVPLAELGLEPPGPLSTAERRTLVLFAATALLWVFRGDLVLGSALTIPGWSRLLPNPKGIHDGTVAMAMALVAFLVPSGVPGRRLVGWGEFRKAPWEILILFGGGFSLAEGLEASGFSRWCGERLSFLGGWPPALTVLAVALFVTLLSEMASNVATATAMMPVMAAVATRIGVHPWFLMLPAVLAASSGFALPVATAPNTIVFGTGMVRVREMARAGFRLDLVCALLVMLLTLWVIPAILGVDLRVPPVG